MSESSMQDVRGGPSARADLDFAFANPENLKNEVFFNGLARIREADPVFLSANQHGWLLTRHKDVADAFNDKRLSAVRLHLNQFSSIPEDERASTIPNLMKYIPQWIINVDGDVHARLRRLVMKAFGRKIVESLRPKIQGYADELLNEAEKKGEFDFIEQIAFPLPAMVITALFGLPKEHIPHLREWALNMTTALASVSPSRDILLTAEQTIADMNAVIGEQIKLRRETPKEDLLSALVHARDENDYLSEEELLGISHVLLIAGHDTTANSLGLGVRALCENPQQKEYYLDQPPEKGMELLQELLRYIAMSSAQVRISLEPISIDDKTIPPGAPVFLMIAAANRDPSVFENPDELDFKRSAVSSVTFGPGFHHCVGHLLARAELDILFRSLFSRFSRVEILDSDPPFTPNYAFRSLTNLPIRVSR
jgi:cytochrome P450